MRILKTYNGLSIPDTISKKKENPHNIHKSPSDGGTTQGTTKSGNIIFVNGENESNRKRALQYFLKVYNNDFSTEEQKKNGNLIYNLKSSKSTHGGFAATTIAIPNKIERKKYHISKRRIIVLSFTDQSSKMEFPITHELVHTRRFSNNQTDVKKHHNEKRIDFETTGRITKEGIRQTISKKTPWVGTYYNVDNKNRKDISHYGNEDLAKLKLPEKQKLKIASDGIIRDRKLLTGSINTNIIGNTAVTRTEKLFPKSFLNAKLIIQNKNK